MSSFMLLILLCLMAASVGASGQTPKRQNGRCFSPTQRRSWTSLNDAEKVAYINAERCLQTTPARYGIPGARVLWDELQFVHIRQFSFIHGVGAFLPWHRYYMKVHEHLLQQHCGFAGGVPYWNEAVEASNILSSTVWNPDTGMGGDGAGPDRCVSSGPFVNLTLVMNGDLFTSAGAPYCLTRQITPNDFLDTDQSHISECFAITTFWEAASCYGNAPHWGGHAGVGGLMGDAMRAPGDPIFFLHHANLDRLYWLWQQADVTRLTAIGGPNVPTIDLNAANGWTPPGPEFTQYSGDPGAETTLNHNLWVAGILPNVTIASVLDLHGDTICADYV